MNNLFQRLSSFPFSIFLFSLFLFASCKKETVNVSSTLPEYFPTEKGRWIDYSVDSIYHSENDNNNDDSVYSYHFQVKEIIDTAFQDGAGQINQVIKRYRRMDSSYVWSLSNVWTQMLTPTAAFRTEDNVSFHKLSFPINTTITWNGNDVNILDEEIYSYEYVHQPSRVNAIDFDSTVSVLQIDENNFVEKLYGNEVYAAGVGLVYKENDELGKRNGVIVKGLEYKMQIIGFGKY